MLRIAKETTTTYVLDPQKSSLLSLNYEALRRRAVQVAIWDSDSSKDVRDHQRVSSVDSKTYSLSER